MVEHVSRPRRDGDPMPLGDLLSKEDRRVGLITMVTLAVFLWLPRSIEPCSSNSRSRRARCSGP